MVRKFLLIALFPLSIAAQPTVDSLLSLVNRQFNGASAYNHVKFFSQFWRVPGGKDFNTCVDHIADALDSAGLSLADSRTMPAHSIGYYYIQRDSLADPVWNPIDARLTVVSPVETTLQSYAIAPVMLCQNSFPIDTTLELVDVGNGDSESDYAGVDVRGRIAFGYAGVNS